MNEMRQILPTKAPLLVLPRAYRSVLTDDGTRRSEIDRRRISRSALIERGDDDAGGCRPIEKRRASCRPAGLARLISGLLMKLSCRCG
jgi:hypothetical protein